MNERVKHLTEEAAKLTPEERVELVERINLTLWDHQAEVNAAWEAEIERRVVQIDNGEAMLIDYEDVMREMRSKL